MMEVRNVTGFEKGLFLLYLKVSVFFHFLPCLLRGEVRGKQFIIFLRRLLYFVGKLKHNKFVTIGKDTRIDMYIPGFPSPAFYTACRKFLRFGERLPCATVLISVTSACVFDCRHCYQKLDRGKDCDIHVLMETVKKLQEMGIAFFNIEGGEPFLTFERLRQVCATIDDRSEIWINSTGHGMNLEKLRALKEQTNVTAMMFSMHYPDPERFNRFMGSDKAWETMENGVALCHQAGLAVTFNICLQKEDLYNGTLEQMMDRARKFGAALVQLIKPKPAGAWLENGPEVYTPDDIAYLKKVVNRYNLKRDFRDYPVISAQVIEEAKEVFGCTAGGTDRFYINAKGDLQPCEFLNLSYGNIATDDFTTIYQKMRACFQEPGECWLCEKYAGKIHQLFTENQLSTLPLSPELSGKVYNNWDRGAKTEMYQALSKE